MYNAYPVSIMLSHVSLTDACSSTIITRFTTTIPPTALCLVADMISTATLHAATSTSTAASGATSPRSTTTAGPRSSVRSAISCSSHFHPLTHLPRSRLLVCDRDQPDGGVVRCLMRTYQPVPKFDSNAMIGCCLLLGT